MTEFQAAVLGILQGAGEFLPISSSAHLALAPKLFGWSYQGLAYDVMLHMGTLLAVLVYFAKDWVKILHDGFAHPRRKRGRLLWLLAAGSIPAGIAGLLLHDLAETAFRDPRWIAFNLIFFSLFIYLADRKPAQLLNETSFTLKDALLIGLAQTIALMPGASRCGMTIMAALFLGYSRPAAARLSFLLGTPVIFGAGLLEAVKLTPADLNAAFACGVAASFISGLAVIGLFLAWLKKRGLAPFLIYRVLLGAGILCLPMNNEKPSSRSFVLLAPSPWAPSVSTGAFRPGDSLDSVFGQKIPSTDILAIEKALKKAGAGVLQPGDIYAVSFSSCGEVTDFTPDAIHPCPHYRTSRTVADFVLARGQELYSVSRKGREFGAQKGAVPVITSGREPRGTVENSLWEAMSGQSAPPAVIMGFADIFAWKIDFLTEPRKGDSFALLWEERRTALGAPCPAKITGAAYRGEETGEEYAFYYGNSYYDEKGGSLRRTFLRAPLSYRRISSYFSRSRFHPILRIFRPHNGIDYAAPSGTPVSAVADGTVTFAGRKGGYGKFIELRHGGTYVTGYGHLRSFAKGVRAGKQVTQGEVIGYVGRTGLATGPHLDFSIKKNGRFVNFLKLELPPAASLKGAELKSFIETIKPLKDKLKDNIGIAAKDSTLSS
ncbi:MAG: peptidoglycan DD-metalloendopeptidase family protein [Elusimicrobia bacterium]|nr:peptidoglycan DD-metalloendopeptidase family protein [Elusimicrobiota bacterium]